MDKTETVKWLREEREEKLALLWQQADGIRRRHVGDEVQLRGLIEISNICHRACHYCGISAGNRKTRRYRMTAEEIMACVAEAVAYGYGTVVMQAGEDEGISTDWMAEIIQQIRRETSLAVTLSLGERSVADLTTWRRAGADRYLLRFETSNRKLYERIHPPWGEGWTDRLEILSCQGLHPRDGVGLPDMS